MGYVKNDDVTIHFLDSGSGTGCPVFMLPGALSRAEMYKDEMDYFRPRRSIAMSFRGRGSSGAPPTGYTFADHVSDLNAVLQRLALRRVVLLAFSMSVPIAVEMAAADEGTVQGLILCDYPPRWPNIPAEWVEQARMDNDVKTHVPHRLQLESEATPLWDKLPDIACPTLILHGTQPGAMLDGEQVARMAEALPLPEVIAFKSGHALWEPSYEHFMTTITDFLERID